MVINASMEKPIYKIVELQSKSNLPFSLLLLADETIEAIEKYIYDSDVYVVSTNKQLEPIAVFALYRINDKEIEIKNIAVLEALQGEGIGSYLISEIKKIARKKNFDSIIVGTPDSAFGQIKFYERNGFIKYDVRKDFFVENYAEPIIEGGTMLRDMILLKANC